MLPIEVGAATAVRLRLELALLPQLFTAATLMLPLEKLLPTTTATEVPVSVDPL